MKSQTTHSHFDPYREDSMKNYLKGKLGAEEMHAMEMAALQDPMLEDALEGLRDEQAFAHVTKIRNKVRSKTAWWNNSIVKSIAIILVSAAVVTLIYSPEEDPSIAQLAPINAEGVKVPERNTNDAKGETGHSTVIESTSTDSGFQVTLMTPVENYIERHEPFVSTAEPVAPQIITGGEQLDDDKTLRQPSSGEQIRHIENYKLVDYSGKREQEIELLTPILNSTHPSLEHSKDSLAEGNQEFTTEQVPYNDYLQTTMKSFASGNYRKSIRGFETILKTYPDDINALFYGGMAHFQTRKYEDAISYLKKAADHPIVTFRQEATYYQALSMIKNGDEFSGIKVLEKIAAEEGFYASAAREYLTKR